MGSKGFVETTKTELDIRAKGRRVRGHEETYERQEPRAAYGDNSEVKNGGLTVENTCLLAIYPNISI
jgi:hypothetical protein